MKAAKTILFDLGGVLIDWNPRYVYRELFPDAPAMEDFLLNICGPEWNATIDAGKPFAEAVRERQEAWPEFEEYIGFWQTRWGSMLRGEIAGSVAVLKECQGRGLDLCALTNWSAETFPIAQKRFPFLAWFRRIVVSGEVGLAKPDPAIFELALRQCGLVAETTLFIDDSAANVAVARELGMDAIHFQSPAQLREELLTRRLLP